ncbi:hypothetical protein GCM10027422_27410 [Hymenobacter arcticus]
MNAILHTRSFFVALGFVVGLLVSGCGREVAPYGTLTTTIIPLGIAKLVTATATDGHSYTATPDPTTGLVSFATIPAGSYNLTFDLIPASFNPLIVPVTVVAGQSTQAKLPRLTHDGTVRGTMTWVLQGEKQVATQFSGNFSDGFYLRGNAIPAAAPKDVSEMQLGVPTVDPLAAPFMGAGIYPVGPWAYGPVGVYRYFRGGFLSGDFDRYLTPVSAVPIGDITLTQFDKQAGIAAGTFAFRVEGIRAIVISQGQFNITF